MGYKSGYRKARESEANAEQQWLADYEAAKGRYGEALGLSRGLLESVLSQYDQLSDQDKQDLMRAYQADMANRQQALSSRGLASSSVLSTETAGNAREQASALNRLADARLRERLGYETGLTGAQINLLQAGPTAPSTAFLNSMIQNLGQAQQFYTQQRAQDISQQGRNKSWSAWLSDYSSPGAVEQRFNTALEIGLGVLGVQQHIPGVDEQNAAMRQSYAQSAYGPPSYAGGYGAQSAAPGYQYNPNAAAMWSPYAGRSSYTPPTGSAGGQSLGTGVFSPSDITAFPMIV